MRQYRGVSAPATSGVRLLDYVDLHTYYAATHNGNSVAFATAGDTGVQQARLDSTRAFWDPTCTDPNIVEPNFHPRCGLHGELLAPAATSAADSDDAVLGCQQLSRNQAGY
jgi:hypothetical protein